MALTDADLLAQTRAALDRYDGEAALALLADVTPEKESAETLACLIEAHSLTRSFDAAEAAFTRASGRFAQDIAIYIAAGFCAMQTRNYPLAEQRYAQAVKIKPGYAPAHNNLGMVYEYLHRDADARAAYAQAIAHDPALAPPYRNLGRMAEMGGKLDEARGYYEQGRARAGGADFGTLLDKLGHNYAEAPASAAGPSPHEDLLAAELGKAALRHLPPDRKFAVLDLICGHGITGDLLWRKAGVVIGVDPRVPLLQQAQARGVYYDLKEARPADFLRTCKRGETDLITANCAFVDQGDLLPVFLNIYAVLAPGGLLAMAFPTQKDNLGYYIEGPGLFSHDPRYIAERADFEGMQQLERIDYAPETHPGLDRTYSLMVFAKPRPA